MLRIAGPSHHSMETPMTDQTAIQVSPVPSEEDMNLFRSMFERAANALTQASELAGKVAALSAEIDALKADIEASRKHNAWLDEHLAQVRQERDKAIIGRADLEQALITARRESDHWQSKFEEVCGIRDNIRAERDEFSDALEQVRKELDAARRDRDDAQLQVMELTEERDRLKAEHEYDTSVVDGLRKDNNQLKEQLKAASETIARVTEAVMAPHKEWTHPDAPLPKAVTDERSADSPSAFVA